MHFQTVIGSCLCFLLLSTCADSDKPGTLSLDLPIEDTLAFVQLNLPHEVYNVGRIATVNEQLVIFDRSNQGRFKVFGLPHYEYLFTYPKDGEEPDMHSFIDHYSMESWNGRFYYLDYPYYRKVNINQQDKTFDRLSAVDFSNINQDVNRVVPLNDTLYMTMNYTPELDEYQHLLFSSNHSQVLEKFGVYPEDGTLFEDPMEKSMHYIYQAVSNAQAGRIAVFYGSVNLIRFYNFAGDLIKEIKVGPYQAPASMDEQKVYFQQPQAVSEGIYVLYFDVHDLSFNQDPEGIRPEIHLYSWDGELLRRFFIDAPVYTFGVADKAKKIIAATAWEGQPIIEMELVE
ncbi:BF3164 family lipoprotein [Neolewinella lacunae]|uniref:TolB-like 6-blade propeller-like n=1 Tax=Neolewinella lacunae TaxID=1517758 RepID=A0A923PNE8_9BACT|nr:BF3164 family lipoprotein [Neolewinella lacunae]MBC6994443.1 hypothetical protein [Neolewinella lacunae]MDN3633379.1 BF3164 family lipoprotein [Neolewinella lacunae]